MPVVYMSTRLKFIDIIENKENVFLYTIIAHCVFFT